MHKQPRLAQLKITELSKNGLGKGDRVVQGGQTSQVEVPFSMPGDEVIVQLLKKKKGVVQGRALEWVQSAENRENPLCKHFGMCGGCRWQHISYQEQLKFKEDSIHRSFTPFIHEQTVIYPIIPCDPPWRYRNKMELSFSSDKNGKRYLGLILYGTRGHVFQMDECHLAGTWMVDAVHAVSKWWEGSGLEAYYGGGDRGSLRTLTLREGVRSGDRMAVVTVSGNPDYALNRKHIQGVVEALCTAIEPEEGGKRLSIFLRIQQICKGKPTVFYEMLLHGPDHIRETLHVETEPGEEHTLHFRISPTAFFQPNTRQAERLYSRVIQLTKPPVGGVVYDLYCGTGTLGICMAKKARRVVGIELSPESALDARENVKLNGLSNVSIETGDVGEVLSALAQSSGEKPDAVVVDPPRVGLDAKAIQHLLALKAPTITYVSCHPVTQAANLAIFIQEGYQLAALQPVDQFPQTVHIENIAVLKRS